MRTSSAITSAPSRARASSMTALVRRDSRVQRPPCSETSAARGAFGRYRRASNGPLEWLRYSTSSTRISASAGVLMPALRLFRLDAGFADDLAPASDILLDQR